tara:strand:+ start:149 stop:343 length:195 start_codon:yes stop_codon:yes gene_type:complete
MMMFRLLDSIMRASSAMQADISLAVLHRGMCVGEISLPLSCGALMAAAFGVSHAHTAVNTGQAL